MFAVFFQEKDNDNLGMVGLVSSLEETLLVMEKVLSNKGIENQHFSLMDLWEEENRWTTDYIMAANGWFIVEKQ